MKGFIAWLDDSYLFNGLRVIILGSLLLGVRAAERIYLFVTHQPYRE